MSSKQLSIITTTYNCMGDIDSYFSSFSKLDADKFDWIVVDADSTDGTKEFLSKHSKHFSYFVSEADSGFYFGLNKAISQVTTPYYMVFGADDRPSDTILEDIGPLLIDGYSMVLGSVRLMPSGKVKHPGPRWLHHVVWGRAVSHHSVGTIFKTDVHARHGRYDTAYSLVADGVLIKRILKSSEPILRTHIIFGDFMLGGMSSKLELRSMVETYLLQITEGSNPILQLILLNIRTIKRYFFTFLKKYFN